MTNIEAGIPTVVAIATLVATRQPVNTRPNAGKRRTHKCHYPYYSQGPNPQRQARGCRRRSQLKRG